MFKGFLFGFGCTLGEGCCEALAREINKLIKKHSNDTDEGHKYKPRYAVFKPAKNEIGFNKNR